MTATDNALDLATDMIAAWRITHLVTADAFPPVQKARDRVLDRYGPDHWASYLVTCASCVGVWAAAGVAVARVAAPRAWRPTARLLAVAAASPIIEARQ